MKNTSVDKQLDFLRWFFRWTLAKRFHDVNDFETFRPKLKKTQNRVVFLTKDELEKLKKYVAPEDRKNLERVRDVFLFQCCTGLRYSDVFNLRRCDVHEDHIDVTTIKTNDTLRIELNEESKSILDRYKNITYENDKAFHKLGGAPAHTGHTTGRLFALPASEHCHAALPYRSAHGAEDRTRMAGKQGFSQGIYEL